MATAPAPSNKPREPTANAPAAAPGDRGHDPSASARPQQGTDNTDSTTKGTIMPNAPAPPDRPREPAGDAPIATPDGGARDASAAAPSQRGTDNVAAKAGDMAERVGKASVAETTVGLEALRELSEASRAYVQAVGEAQAKTAKRYHELLDNLGQAVQSIARDRTAADLIARYQVEVMRRSRTQELSDLHQQYADTVQKLLRLQEEHTSKLLGAIEALQAQAAKLNEDAAPAEVARKRYTEAVSAVAQDQNLGEIDPSSLARLGYGILAAAAIRAQSPRS
jgi:hypothetical protein